MCGPKPCNDPWCTWSEAFRNRCEAQRLAQLSEAARHESLERITARRSVGAVARLVLALPLAQRRAWLLALKLSQAPERADTLQAEMMKTHEAEKVTHKQPNPNPTPGNRPPAPPAPPKKTLDD